VGERRLEIVLPGRRTELKVMSVEALTEADLKGGTAQAPEELKPFAGGSRLVIRLKPPLYLDDVRNRIQEESRQGMPGEAPAWRVVGAKASGDQYEEIAVWLPLTPTDKEGIARWEELIQRALRTQRDVSRVKRLVKQAGFLEFRIVADRVKDRDKANFDRIVRLKQAGHSPDNPRYRWYPMKKGYERHKEGSLDAWNFIYVVDEETKTVEVLVDVGDGQDVTGQDLSGARGDTQDGYPIVSFRMEPKAEARFARLTQPENKDRQLAIILDDVIQSAPVLRAQLSKGGIIEGYKNNVRERDDVVTILNSGQLAASLGDPIAERTVGPELGRDNIEKGTRAMIIGLTLVVAFMVVYYLFAGVVADMALMLNLTLIVCIMHWMHQSWTLPGIAGLVLTMGMSVDANVLIFERLREEKGREGSLGFALKRAYSRAFRTILDSNVTTLIPAFILLLPQLATEEVRGFAIVIIVGILTSMFAALIVTRMVFETVIGLGIVKKMTMLQLFRAPNINWMRLVRPAIVVSGVLVLAGAIAFYKRGDSKYDIEFTGGTQVELALKVPQGQDKIPIEGVRRRVASALGLGATVQELQYEQAGVQHVEGEETSPRLNRFLISVSSASGGAAANGATVKAALTEAFADLRPESRTGEADVKASEITEDLIRGMLLGAKAPAAGEAEKAAGPESEGGVRFIPPEYRQYLGKVRLVIDLRPPRTLQEIRRRIDVFLRDRYSNLISTLYRVDGARPGERAGEYASCEVWIAEDFKGSRGNMSAPAFWTDVVRSSLGAEEAFASTTSFERTMAAEAWNKAVIAIVFSLLAIILYMWFRFAKAGYGVAAVVALVHDVFITLGAVACTAAVAAWWTGNPLLITDMRINLPMVGAFLTLIGYSVNDTVVVFDRIRENRGKFGELSVEVVNRSINQTLSRTIWTSLTTFVVVAVLYVRGGTASTLHGFSFVLTLGIIVGTYSSVAIASPILVQRGYLFRIYVWAFPVLGFLVLGYYAAVWQSPQQFFGTWVGWAWAGVQILWIVLATWALWAFAYKRPWGLKEKAPWLATALAGLGLLMVPAMVVFCLLMLFAPERTAWAGPAAVRALTTLPASYALYRLVWGTASQKR
jgi:SecD/SecF fusion protein